MFCSSNRFLLRSKRRWHIIHNGAHVNSTLPYRSLYASNVLGTCCVIRFANATRSSMHHISTIGMLSSSGVVDELHNVPSAALSLLSGYAQSKWVAEQCVVR